MRKEKKVLVESLNQAKTQINCLKTNCVEKEEEYHKKLEQLIEYIIINLEISAEGDITPG
jgi:hypothetical protein